MAAKNANTAFRKQELHNEMQSTLNCLEWLRDKDMFYG